MSKRKSPVILIPGIQGTKLVNINNKDFTTIWSGFKSNFKNVQSLKLQDDGFHDLTTEILIERSDVENFAYSEIVNYLRNLGYRVFIFGYDWRKSNEISAQKLDAFIEELKGKLHVRSFNFLTHSMGGLVLSAFFKRKNETELDHVVNKVIFTVPPFLGSPEATFNLIIGNSRLFNSGDELRKVSRTFPGVYELLPVYEDAYRFENSERQELLNFYDFNSYWQQVKPELVVRNDTRDKHRLIRNRLIELKKVRSQNNFIFDFKAIKSESLLKKTIVLAGTGVSTRKTIGIKDEWEHIKNLFNFEEDKFHDNGDGTVPLVSAGAIKSEVLTLGIKQKKLETWANSHFFMHDWHAFFLNNGRVQNIITRFFNPDFENENSSDWFKSTTLKSGIEIL